MSLFNTPGTGKTFFRPSPGQYIGEFVAHEEGPPSRMYTNNDGSPKEQIRWVWNITNLDGTPVLNDDGEVAEGDGLTSTATGPKSKAAEWFAAHGYELTAGEDMDAASEAIVGNKVLLLYTATGDVNDHGRQLGRLKVVMPYEG